MNNLTPQDERPVAAPSNSPNTVIQYGQRSTYIGQVNTVQATNVSNIILATSDGVTTTSVATSPLSQSYYNLFVVSSEEFRPYTQGHFILDPRRVLIEYTNDAIKNAWARLSPENIEAVKSLPCIFTQENSTYGYNPDDDCAFFGQLLDIKIQASGIKIYYAVMQPIPKKVLFTHAHELDIFIKPSGISELNRTHWAIKNIDLIETLHDAGVRSYGL